MDYQASNQLRSVKDTAAALGCSVATVWRWAAKGTIAKPLKIGGTTRWKQSDIDEVIRKAEKKRTSA